MKSPNVCMVTEYMANGSLRDILADKSATMDWNMKMKIGHSVAFALSYLHGLKPPLIHGDINPACTCSLFSCKGLTEYCRHSGG